ncbi:MAG: pyridoxine 5'-phosphate synthase, partial [Desulfotignum sp.]|nr:pyridoxine 5'-phosphate synthase [Desulfotignum sp.]
LCCSQVETVPLMDTREIRTSGPRSRFPSTSGFRYEETDIEAARQVRPEKVILAPEKMDRAGWSDLKTAGHKIAEAVRLFHRDGIPVSVLAAPDASPSRIGEALRRGFYPDPHGRLCQCPGQPGERQEIERIYAAADQVVKAGLKVSAGGGLTRDNLLPVLKTRALEELTVGICRHCPVR